MSILSPSRDRTFVHKMPAAVKALSASTDDGGILNKYLYIPIPDRGLVCHLTRTSPFPLQMDGYQLGFLHFYEALVTTALDSDALTASSIRCLRVRFAEE